MAVANEQELDRNEAATPHKLEEARKRAQVAKSADVVSAVIFTAAAAAFAARGWDATVHLFGLDRQLLGALLTQAQHGRDANFLVGAIAQTLTAGLGLLVPWLTLIVLTAILANMGQTGPIWSWHPIKPDWQRLSPAVGFKRIWSLRTLFDGFRACVKLVLLSLVVGVTLIDLLPRVMSLGTLTARGQTGLMLQHLGTLVVRVAGALCVVALLDLAFVHREFAKNMRMSRREQRDEQKNRDGDPRIRARLRELRREMLKRSLAVRRTAEADLVLINPTHIAVALRYRHGEMAAPVVVSKGSGALAAVMRAIAARHRIPTLRSPALARALHARTPLQAPIPLGLYPEVARLMAWVLASRKDAARARTT